MSSKSFIIKKIALSMLIFCCLFGTLSTHAAVDVWNVLRSEFTLNHDTSRPEVQAQIRWLIAHPSYIYKVCRQSEPYIYHIVHEVKKRNLPGELALLPMIESAYDPFAYSGVGAAGLWQLMPLTGTDLGLKQDWWYDGRRSISSSTDAALNYLLYLKKFFNGNWNLAIASYDAGLGTISRASKATGTDNFWDLPVPQETQVYVPRLLALAEIINNPQRYKLTLPEIPYIPYFQEVNIGSQIDLNHAAKMAGITYKELIKLNPGYNRWTTAPYKPFKLLIPKEKVYQFSKNLANVPEEKRVSWTKHYVRDGDNLDNIATRYHTTVNLIKQLNQLTTNQITLNQTILIPSSANTPSPVPKHEIVKLIPIEHQVKEVHDYRVIHIVQNNDSFQSLEKMYGAQPAEIQNWNKLASNQPLYKGQQLIIWKRVKQPIQYIVKKGDSLGVIARQHQTNINTIIRLNPGIRGNAALQPGQKLLIG